ncbi:unnamed protein product [Lymnaea stagnalis]|uniref:PHD-type domain-containing protein n=1 Tax=Lymnaea stagnalis TaxID=6523 RepID=A0AAV2I5T1_LYMST
MNHHYPDNYGYGRGTPAIPGMGFAGSGYTDPSAMTRMGQPREGYQMSHYPVMQPQSGMYGQGGFMGQQGNPYNMSGYSNYGMQGMNQSSMMGGNRQGDMTRMGTGNVINPYYNTVMSPDPHASPQHASMNNQAVNYSHTQANSLMQQPHMSMVSGKNSAIMSNQGTIGPIPTQNSGPSAMTNQSMHSQGAHSPVHMMSQVGALQNSGTYGNQTSPHMIPRTHHVPQHPMRHPTTQQNPQEVADNILQMASAYPSNQTVQVPLKSRPAPYHIPRSPHYSVSHSDLPHTSPNPHQQQQSPVNCQTSPSPSSSVKSPAPVLAPIPNPIPSPGISGLRSPCNQGMSPCGTQRSPGRMGSSYSGHSQGGPPSQCGGETSPYHHNISPSDTHYSPCAMTPTHSYAAYSASPSAQRNVLMYSPSSDHSLISTPEQFRHSNYTISSSSITSSNNVTSYSNSSKKSSSGMSNSTVTNAQMVNSPLMSLQKLVMLPETQVVDPKSVVNDACLSSHDEAPKNADSPAERLVEGSSHSVGSQCNSSSYRNQSGNTTQDVHLSENISDVNAVEKSVPAQQTSTSFPLNEQVQVSSNLDNNEDLLCNANKNLHQNVNSSPDKKLKEETVITFDHNETPEQNWSPLHQILSDSETKNSLNPSHFIAADDRLSSGSIENLTEKTQAIKTNGHHIPSKPLTILTNSETKKIIIDGVEKSSNTLDRAIHSPDRKNGKIKDDVKRLMVQCRSPGVLSEVPVITNGLINGRVRENDDEIDQDCDLAVHAKLHNGFSSLVKVKLASSKRASQFARVTPCSIAVGADERAACDRFVYRRNGICRSLRTTRIIFNGRNRNDSTGNADSDESLENVSESNFGISDSPQDGNKKRSNTPKRSECKKPDLNSMSTSNKVNESDTKSAEPVTSGSNGCMSYNNNEISDDDVCYYEGVDSSDIFINNCSSDESLTSSGELKHNKLLTPYKGADENQHHTGTSSNLKPAEQEDTEEKTEKESSPPEPTSTVSGSVSSPPSKRLRRSSGQKAKEKLKALSIMRSPNSSANNKVENDKIPEAVQTKIARVKKELDVSLSEEVAIEQIVKSDHLRSSSKTPVKYPVVVLEKSSISKSPIIKEEKYDLIDLTDACNDGASAGLEYLQACDTNESKKIKLESQETTSAKPIKKNADEMEVGDQLAQVKPIPRTPNRKPRRRPHRMKSVKKKDKLYGKGKRNDEVKDSFKSMKFSRTLDLMKARRRRETSSLGPFIRVTGKPNAPDTVSVFNQPVPELAIVAANNKHSKSKKLHSLPNVTTVHMVTNLPTDKTAMISSNRTISQDPWVCAFCSHHSSYRFLGDLFGPYFKESEINDVESIALEESKKSDMSKELKTPDFNIVKKKANDLNLLEKINSGSSRKRGKSALTLKPPEQNLAPPEEVWIHEACAIWSPGVCMVGNKLYGLDEAVKDARDTLCSVCKSKGAMIGCLHKGCSMKYHFICAVDKKECFLDEENLSLLCPKHKDKKISFAGPSKS